MGRLPPEYWTKFNQENPENGQKLASAGCFVIVCFIVGVSILWLVMDGKLMTNPQNKKIEMYKDTLNNLYQNITDTVEINTK